MISYTAIHESFYFTLAALLGTAYLSYKGGVWLWQNSADSFEQHKTKIRVGAFSLFSVCSLTTGFIINALFVDGLSVWQASVLSIGLNLNSLNVLTLLLAFSLAYNLGYLFSILPSRFISSSFQQVWRKELLLLGVAVWFCHSAGSAVVNGSGAFGNVMTGEVFYFMAKFASILGLALFLLGFGVWERLRQMAWFEDESLRTSLWHMSWIFDSVCLLVVLSGILASKFPVLIAGTMIMVLLIFISLMFYCVGLLMALK